jgi:hypothetical protein
VHLVEGRGAGGKLRPDAGQVREGVRPEPLESSDLVEVFVHFIAHRGDFAETSAKTPQKLPNSVWTLPARWISFSIALSPSLFLFLK